MDHMTRTMEFKFSFALPRRNAAAAPKSSPSEGQLSQAIPKERIPGEPLV